ncbi:MAG: TIGR03560 family F420-dependent LLM class oxidoreductase, partial [Ilumatobacteraceae bacterium]
MLVASGSLVVLAGPSGAGKSVWAAERFRPHQVVSSDALRATVGVGERDQWAGADAFDVLALIVERRLKRGLTTVVDSLGLDAKQRARWLAAAHEHDRPTVAVAFDTEPAECRRRNKRRPQPVPSKALTSQLTRWPDVRDELANEFDTVAPPGDVRVVPPALHAHRHLTQLQEDTPMQLRFGLSISSFTWPGESVDIGPRLAAIARDAEAAGFSSMWVMDHVIQIPQVGREWEPMLESTTTLGFLAAATERIRLGTLVTGISYRNVAHVGKIAATLDVLSGGRAMCGLGAAWFDREHTAYGWDMPPLAERFELLEDALELFPLLWGPGAPSFSGRRVEVAEAICYPRPIQERIPILVGGSGERRTLQLVARHAAACNLFGEPDEVRRKIGVLHEHCTAEGRDPAEISVTQLSPILCADEDALAALGSDDQPAEVMAERLNAGTPDDHIGRFRALADAGV